VRNRNRCGSQSRISDPSNPGRARIAPPRRKRNSCVPLLRSHSQRRRGTPHTLTDWIAAGRFLGDYPQADRVDTGIFSMTCDIAIPAVLEGTMNADDAARLQVKLVVRGATGM
jgi:hypothetical protein